MNYAYARVSSKDQNLSRQLNALKNCDIAFKKIYCDKESGVNFERANYKQLIKKLRYGDLLVITSIDRLGRNYDCIQREWKRITKSIGADIYVLDMPLLDTRCHEKNLVGKLIADIVLELLSFVAEHERENIRSRQAEGIEAAKFRGVKFGRPPLNCPDNFNEIADAYLERSINLREALQATEMKRSTFYAYLQKYSDNKYKKANNNTAL